MWIQSDAAGVHGGFPRVTPLGSSGDPTGTASCICESQQPLQARWRPVEKPSLGSPPLPIKPAGIEGASSTRARPGWQPPVFVRKFHICNWSPDRERWVPKLLKRLKPASGLEPLAC